MTPPPDVVGSAVREVDTPGAGAGSFIDVDCDRLVPRKEMLA
jgi:hypothetical protein